MNENALRMEMGIPLVPRPKHTISEIHDHDESDSSSGTDEDLEDLILLGQTEDCIRPPAPPEAESDSSKDTQTDQKSTETSVINLQRGFTPRLCNTRFTKEHKPSNHIRARIKSHVYTTE